MKKYLILLCLLSFTLFSCASKDSLVDSTDTTLDETIENNEQTETTTSVETVETNESTDNIASETSVSSLDYTNNDVQDLFEVELSQLINDELEEIIEPEVITLEPPLESEQTVSNKTAEALAEPVQDDAIAEAEKAKAEAEALAKAEELAKAEAEAKAKAEEEAKAAAEKVALEEIKNAEIAEVSDITDVTDVEDIENESAEQEAAQKPEEIIEPSRSVTLKKLEYLDITYPGSGWIYMGITDGSKDLTYFGRKVGTANTKFSVQAKVEGTKILHFYKNDSLTNTFIDDYIEVVVLNEKGSNKTRIEAPEYKVPVQKKKSVKPVAEKTSEAETSVEAVETKKTETKTTVNKPVETKTTETKSVEPKTVETKPLETKTAKVSNNSNNTKKTQVIDITEEVDAVEQPAEEVNTDELLKEIRELVKTKSYKAAKDKLVTFFEHATTHRDEALYLQGQVLEAKSEVQNISAAIDSYTTLTKNFPASKFWDDANKRIIYLKRFYLEGR